MISLSFFCLLALAFALPQPLSQPRHDAVLRSIDRMPPQPDDIKAAAVARTQPSKRTDSTGVGAQANVLVCEHVFWTGKCETKTYTLGSDECAPLDVQTSSVRPDPGVKCVFYKNNVCRDFNDEKDSLVVGEAGVENLLVTAKGDLNDQLRGFQCWKAG